MRQFAALIAVSCCASCSFDEAGLGTGAHDGGVAAADAAVNASADASPTIDPIDAPIAPPPDAQETAISDDVAHVPSGGEFGGVADLTLDSSTIDTSALTIDNASPPAGVVFDLWAQEALGNGAAITLAVLHVDALRVQSGAVISVVGARPLVIIASGPISIESDAVIDAGARHGRPGPGGAAGSAGPGRGGNGSHEGEFRDGGGGGAGFGSPGARGGRAECTQPECARAEGGEAGAGYGTAMLTTLAGGSGGGMPGAAGDCSSAPAGGGGGAIQLYSAVAIHISINAGINVGGGGGGRGFACEDNWGAAAGGGSGGAIFLQAPTVSHQGMLAANGGAGGGSAGFESGAAHNGTDGQDGELSVAPAEGGDAGGGVGGADGGDGATGSVAAERGDDEIVGDGNGGGAGAGVGRIVVLTSGSFDNTLGVSSPEVVSGSY